MNKRLLKELSTLIVEQNSKPLLENNYLVHFEDENINKVHTIIKAPYDSVYRHKFILLDFDIPNDYPHSPPKVSFINYDSVRIHPSFYEDGRCCSTILNTWPSDNEKWTSSMGIETILLTFSSFLDNNPYTYEPGGRDDNTYTDYVLYTTWESCLIKYLEYKNCHPDIFYTYINNYLLYNIDKVFDDLNNLQIKYVAGLYYTKCFEIENYIINYNSIICKLDDLLEFDIIIEEEKNILIQPTIVPVQPISNGSCCNVCFENVKGPILLDCNHIFHKNCIKKHIQNNGKVCSFCRIVINDNKVSEIMSNKRKFVDADEYVVNPNTKRKVKKGSKTYLKLIKNDEI